MSRDLKIVSGAMLAWGVGEGMFFIFRPLYLQQFGADPILIGTILGINGLVMAVVQIPAGYLADKFGRRPLMRFAWICGAVATWVMALAPSLGFFVAGLLLYGVTSCVMPPLNSYVQQARGKWSVGRAVSFVSAIYNLGGILGPIMGGFLGEAFDLRFVYYIAGIIFSLSTIILFFAKKQIVLESAPQAGDQRLLQNKPFLLTLGLILLVMFAVTLPQPLAANFLQNQRGLSLSRIGQLGSIGALGSVFLMLVFGGTAAPAALAIGQVGLVLFALFLWQGGGLIWYGLAYFFLGGYRLCRAMTLALVQPIVSEREVGLAFGIVESLNALAYVGAPVLAGVLYDWQPTAVFPVGLILLLMTLLLSIAFLSRYRHWEVKTQDEA